MFYFSNFHCIYICFKHKYLDYFWNALCSIALVVVPALPPAVDHLVHCLPGGSPLPNTHKMLKHCVAMLVRKS